jgi:hypothetical protein
MEGRLDHLERELSDWEAREQKFRKLFGNSVVDSKAFLKEKLAFYEVLDLKYGSRPGLDPLGRQLIRQEKHKLERKVYPNLLVRLAYKLIASVVAKKELTRYDARQADNLKSVQANVVASGFEGLDNIVAQKSGHGLKEFSIPISDHVNERQKMDYDLKFSRGADGDYQFEGYQAKLSEGQRNEANACLIEPLTLKPEQAYNLLCGRPVLHTDKDQSSRWVQLDLNDKDEKGNLKIRKVSREIGFDLAALLENLPLKNADEVKHKVLAGLENGGQILAVFEVKGKEYSCNLVASPLRNEISVFNDKMEQVSPVDLKPKARLANGETKEMEKVNRKQMKLAR